MLYLIYYKKVVESIRILHCPNGASVALPLSCTIHTVWHKILMVETFDELGARKILINKVLTNCSYQPYMQTAIGKKTLDGTNCKEFLKSSIFLLTKFCTVSS